MKDKKIIRNSQHGFTKGKPCLTNPFTFDDEMIASVDKGRLVDVIHLGTSKALDAASHSILIWKLRKYRLEERTVRWDESLPGHQPQRIVINGFISGWLLIMTKGPQGTVLGVTLLNIFISDIDDDTKRTLSKSVGDTKLGTVTESK